MMKRKVFFTGITGIWCVLFLAQSIWAQPPEWLWAKSAGSNGYDYGTSVAIDLAGNAYVTGYFAGTIVFDENHSLTSVGSADIFIAKYDPTGGLTWVQRLGNDDGEYATCITTESDGDFTIGGYFKSDTFVVGSTTLTNAGGNSNDVFLARFDSNGNNMWAKCAGGTADDRAHAIIGSDDGYCLLTGYFASTSITFGNFPLVNTGGGDIFLVRFAPDGTPEWAYSATGTSFDYPRSIALDRSGNCYVSGDFNSGILTIGPFVLDKKSNNDIFVAKFSPSGVPVWAAQAGENSDNSALAVAVDTLENVYIAGSFKSSPLKFGSITLNNAGFVDIFIAKYNSLGIPQWAYAAGGPEQDEARALAIDHSQQVYLSGDFKSASIAFGNTTLNNSTPNKYDLFVTEFTPDGQVFWSKSTGGNGDDVPYTIVVDQGYNFYICGYFGSETLAFGSNTIACHGTTDMFLTKSNNVIPSGINEPGTLHISLYPNPADEKITVLATPGATIEIVDLQGRVIKRTVCNAEEVEVAIGALQKGVYFLRMSTERGSGTVKFMKK